MRLLIVAISFFAASCASKKIEKKVSRRPTSADYSCQASRQIVDQLSYEKVQSAHSNFESFTLCDGLHSARKGLQLVVAGLNHQAQVTNALVEKIKADPQASANCEMEADFTAQLARQKAELPMLLEEASIERIIENRMQDISPSIESFKKVGGQKLSTVCLKECTAKEAPESLIQYSDDPKESRLIACAGSCNVDYELFNTLRSLDPSRAPGEIPNSDKLAGVVQSITAEIADAEKRFRGMDPEMLRKIDRAAYKKSLADLSALETIFEGSACRKARLAVTDRAADSVAQFYHSGEPAGSGFYADEVRDGKKAGVIMTAQHVVSQRSYNGLSRVRTDLSVQKIKGLSAFFPAEKLEVKIKPGMIHAGVDGTKVDSASSAKPLPINELQKLPKVGQRFYLLGNLDSSTATKSQSKLTTHICRFIGYGPSIYTWSYEEAKPGGQFMYYLECPAAIQHIGGMSGGPLVDENGVAWGNLSGWGKIEHPEKGLSYFALAVPIFKNSDGLILMGLQYPVIEPQPCFVPEPWGIDFSDKRSCQLVSGHD